MAGRIAGGAYGQEIPDHVHRGQIGRLDRPRAHRPRHVLQSGKILYYRGRAFRSLEGRGFKSNDNDVETGEEFWISGCKKDGTDRLYGERVPVEVAEDVRVEYWTVIRGQPWRAHERFA